MSDHCWIWIDFDAIKLFRGSTQSLSSVVETPFTMRESKKVAKYISVLESHIQDTRVEQRLDALCEDISMTLEEYIRRYEEIQADINAAMRAGIKAS